MITPCYNINKHHPYSDKRFQQDANSAKVHLSKFLHLETSPKDRVLSVFPKNHS